MKKPTRRQQLLEQFKRFNKEHPEVWKLFVRFTKDRIAQGFEHYSSDAICHRVRWETDQPTYDKDKEFKLNNNFTAFYARRFHRRYPEHDGFFRTRRQISKDT
jgi:hypothetical protein